MFVFGIIGYLIPGNILGSDTNDAFIFGCIPVIGFFVYLFIKANEDEKRPIGALLAVFGCLIIFWAVFHQNGDALTVWAKDYTNRTISGDSGKTLADIGFAQTVTNNGAQTDASSAAYFQNLPAS